MSTYTSYPATDDLAYAPVGTLPANAAHAGMLPRSIFMPVAFLPPVALCGVSWMAGGVPLMTDLGMGALTLACGMLLLAELVNFPRRFGVGGLVLFGGVLVWFCYDYL